jgi:uncharacterized protein YbjT (DUF2867 family)
MYTITGVTGHVGSAAAESLLDHEAAVRVVTRDEARQLPWRQRGADAALADFTDPEALARAMKGSDGAFVMLPTVAGAGDQEHRRMADNIAAAVAESEVPHVVMLSSIGADLPEGTGPIRWLHHLESRLAATGTVLTALRPTHFQEKVETILDAVTAGTYPVFGDSADVPTTMVATRDIGALVAVTLLSPPSASEVVDVEGPAYTEREVAEELESLLGRSISVVTVPRVAWVNAMVEAGLPSPFATELAALYAAEEDGILKPRGDRHYTGQTELRGTLVRVLKARAGGR